MANQSREEKFQEGMVQAFMEQRRNQIRAEHAAEVRQIGAFSAHMQVLDELAELEKAENLEPAIAVN